MTVIPFVHHTAIPLTTSSENNLSEMGLALPGEGTELSCSMSTKLFNIRRFWLVEMRE